MDIKKELADALKGNVVVVGIGNAMRGDDGFGVALAEGLKGRISASVIITGSTPENHIKTIRDSRPDTILVLDAAELGEKAGSVKLIKKRDIPLYGLSTHNASLALFFDFLESDTKADIFMLAVQTVDSGMKFSLSPVVQKKCEELRALLAELLPEAEGGRCQ